MRTGPHLGGGPGPRTGPDPAGRPPWARLRPPPAPAGASSPYGRPMGSALCGRPIGRSALRPAISADPSVSGQLCEHGDTC